MAWDCNIHSDEALNIESLALAQIVACSVLRVSQVHSVAWSCDGRRLASGSFDRTVSIFVLEKDRLVSTVSISLFTIFRFLHVDLKPSINFSH